MYKLFFSIIFLLLPNFSWAIDLDRKDRVKNEPPGYCSWASLETLGRHNDIKPLINLVETRKQEPDPLVLETDAAGKQHYVKMPKHVGSDSILRAKLLELKVKFRMTNTDSKDRSLLDSANSVGVVVGVEQGARGPAAHMIVLTHFDEKTVRFYDCNQPDDIWEGSREWFDYWWTGLSIVVEK